MFLLLFTRKRQLAPIVPIPNAPYPPPPKSTTDTPAPVGNHYNHHRNELPTHPSKFQGFKGHSSDRALLERCSTYPKGPSASTSSPPRFSQPNMPSQGVCDHHSPPAHAYKVSIAGHCPPICSACEASGRMTVQKPLLQHVRSTPCEHAPHTWQSGASSTLQHHSIHIPSQRHGQHCTWGGEGSTDNGDEL